MAPSLYMSFFVPFCRALIKQFEYRVSSPNIARCVERHFCHTCTLKAAAGNLRPWRDIRCRSSATERGKIPAQHFKAPPQRNPSTGAVPPPFVRPAPLPERLRAREIAREASTSYGVSHTCPSAVPFDIKNGASAFHHTAFSAFAGRPLRNTCTHAYPRDRGETCR